MKIIAGLGNPGREYSRTRHNIGFRVVDKLVENIEDAKFCSRYEAKIATLEIKKEGGGEKIALIKPLTFMNRSGKAIQRALKRLNLSPDDLIVVHDDIDLDLGRIRIKFGGQAGGHKGVESIIEEIKTQEFARVRIGIGRPKRGEDLIPWLLSPFGYDEEVILENEILPRAKDALVTIIRQGRERAMSEFNPAWGRD